jgi:hypothetical protein
MDSSPAGIFHGFRVDAGPGRYREIRRTIACGQAYPLTRNGAAATPVSVKQEHTMTQARLSNTSVDAIRDRYRTSFANAFAPQFRYEQMPGAEERTAYAAEYVAYRLGQIDEKLGRLIAIMELGITPSPEIRK